MMGRSTFAQINVKALTQLSPSFPVVPSEKNHENYRYACMLRHVLQQ